jgi:hypothetical protein
MFKRVNNNLNTILTYSVYVNFLSLLLVVYILSISPVLTSRFIKIFNNFGIRLLILFIILIILHYNIKLGILCIIAYSITLSSSNNIGVIDKYSNILQDNFSNIKEHFDSLHRES